MPDPVNTHSSFEEWRKTHPPMMGAETPEAGEQDVQGDEQQEPATTPPWGDDFDAERAWKTIEAQRASEASLKQQLGEATQVQQMWEAAQGDPELQKQILDLWGYAVEEAEEEGEAPAFQDPRVDALIAQQQADKDAALLSSHIEDLAKKENVVLSDRQRQRLERDAVDAGFSPQATEAVFKQFVEDRKAEEQAIIDGYVKSKKGARPAPNGVQGNEKVDFSNEEERLKFMAAQMDAMNDS